MDNFRDTFVGQLLRLVTRNKILQYPDEIHPEAYRQAISTDRTLTQAQSLQSWTTTRNTNILEIDDRSVIRPPTSRHSTARASLFSASSEDTATGTSTPPPEAGPDLTKLETQADDTDTKVVTWINDFDPANPQNWSFFKKCATTGQVCLLTFSIYIGSAIYTAGVRDVEQYFGISEVAAVLGLTTFVLGYGTGPMFIAPFAEAPPIGRSPVYILSIFCFICLNLGVVYARNLGMLLAFRFLTGFVGSPVLATGGASMADIWSPKKRGYPIGTWGIFAVCGPVLGPLIGGFAAEAKGWKWTIWELIWLNGFTFVLLAFCLPETSSATILYHRAHRLRKALGDLTLKTEAEIEAQDMSKSEIARAALWLPFKLTFCEPILLFTDLYLGLVYAVLYCWFEAFPLTFIGVYDFSLGTAGLAYLGILVGALVCLALYFGFLYFVQEKQFENGTLTPEARLPPAIVGSIFLPISLFWFGWTARESVHWIVPIIGSSFFSIGGLLLFNAILNYQGDAYPKYIGSVYAGNDLARSAMGAGFPVFAGAMFRNLGLDWGCSLLGFLSVAFIPIPVALYLCGRKIRLASKFARHDI